MSHRLRTMLSILRKRRGLRKREQWGPLTLRAHQEQALAALRAHATAHSPSYAERHRGLEAAPLAELPPITKRELMARFDEVVTDRNLQLATLERYLREDTEEPLHGRYWVSATSGSSGLRAIIPSNFDEWTSIIASYARASEWTGIRANLRHRTRMAVVSSRTPWHQSARVGATVQSPLVATLRLDAGDSLPDTLARLDAFEPEVLVAYASMLRILAEEQTAGRLHIHPMAVNASSEVLTPHTRQLISEAWGGVPFEVYAATETGGIAAECAEHRGMHVFEDLVIAESVDDNYAPVPDGETGSRLLVTVLHSRSLPLIRYELTDRVRLSARRCDCGRTLRMLEAVEAAPRMYWCCQPQTARGMFASTPWSCTRYGTRFAAMASRCIAREAALKSWSPPNCRWTPLRSSEIFALPLRAQARLQARWWSDEWRLSLRERRASGP